MRHRFIMICKQGKHTKKQIKKKLLLRKIVEINKELLLAYVFAVMDYCILLKKDSSYHL